MTGSRQTRSQEIEFKKLPSTYLAFDFGTRKLGVAVGQAHTQTAQGIATLNMRNGQPDWALIKKLLDEWTPAALIVGLPLHLDASESPMSLSARQFARRLSGRFALPVHMVDERLSSSSADAILVDQQQSGGKLHKHRRQYRDQIAAELILQTFFNSEALVQKK